MTVVADKLDGQLKTHARLGSSHWYQEQSKSFSVEP
jgi:hypothetical protein